MATATQLAELRAWAGSSIATSGSPYTEADIDTRLDELGTIPAVALQILRTMRADLVADPVTFAVANDFSQDASANLKYLDAQIARLEPLVPDAVTGGAVTITTITRKRPRAARRPARW